MNVESYKNEYIGKPYVITYVDKWGFLGRELHPIQSDVGMVGVPVELVEFDVSNEFVYAVFRVQMTDGRFLELLDFEMKELGDYSV
jgi:hypothetical protein